MSVWEIHFEDEIEAEISWTLQARVSGNKVPIDKRVPKRRVWEQCEYSIGWDDFEVKNQHSVTRGRDSRLARLLPSASICQLLHPPHVGTQSESH